MPKAPIGIKALSIIFNFRYKKKRRLTNQIFVLILTFISYAALHATRKSFPVVKQCLQGKCKEGSATCEGGFEPFNIPKASSYFGIMDMSWAFSYAIGMIFMGQIAERTSTKMILFLSLFGTGMCHLAFGFGYYLNIHTFLYYCILQIVNGIIQSGGWPTVVPIVSSWVSKKSMGLILGIWGNHYAIGNIIGQTIAAYYVNKQWGMAFIVNGLICIVSSVLILMFLASRPRTLGFIEDEESMNKNIKSEIEQEDGIETKQDLDGRLSAETPIKFFDALLVPGVLEFSISLFFSKIVIYTFLFWLPYYIKVVGIQGYVVSSSTAGFLATLFDVGGILGNIISGLVLDLTKTGGILCLFLQLCSSFSILIFSKYGNLNYTICVVMLILTGFFINGPNSLITGTISANLSNHKKLNGNKRATSTISAIIDGIGCLGAAIAPIMVSQISHFGWSYVMYSLIICCAFSGLFLTRMVFDEVQNKNTV